MNLRMLLAFALAVISLQATGCSTPLKVPPHTGPVSDHFNGKVFYNPSEGPDHKTSIWSVLRFQNHRNPKRWPKWVEREPGAPPPARVDGRIRATFVNHATVLIQVAGLNILADPIWSDRIGPPVWLGVGGARRVVAPGIPFEQLPKIDYVIISHNHFDHLDLPTLKRLRDRDRPKIVAGLGTAAFLKQAGIDEGVDIDWWQEMAASDRVTIVGVPAHHWSMRWLGDRNHALWLGYVLKTPEGSIYFAGDTAMGTFPLEIKKRLGPPRLSFIPIGAYLPRWFHAEHHVDPAQAIEIHQMLGSELTVPIHYGTFQHGDEGREQPLEDLVRAMRKYGVPDSQVLVLREGEAWESSRTLP